jgi:NADPH:quinone reductase-like Zn-dependent oxidoreductase
VQGTLAERVAMPSANLLDKPPELTFGEAACLPTAYLTAYRMLFTRGGLRPGGTVLVQGATGGVATAAILLARACGADVFATSRTEAGRALAMRLGASQALAPDGRLPTRVDVVIETVGAATWTHSLNAVRNGGTIAVAGATTGPEVTSDLRKVFLREVSVLGTSMGTRDELETLMRFLVATGVRPLIDGERRLSDASEAFARMRDGTASGKLVLTAM